MLAASAVTRTAYTLCGELRGADNVATGRGDPKSGVNYTGGNSCPFRSSTGTWQHTGVPRWQVLCTT